MTEDDFKKEITEIKAELKNISSHTHHPVWKSFFTGMLSGLGSVVGVTIAIAIIGWVLNTIGVIPAFRAQVTSWKGTIEKLIETR